MSDLNFEYIPKIGTVRERYKYECYRVWRWWEVWNGKEWFGRIYDFSRVKKIKQNIIKNNGVYIP